MYCEGCVYCQCLTGTITVFGHHASQRNPDLWLNSCILSRPFISSYPLCLSINGLRAESYCLSRVSPCSPLCSLSTQNSNFILKAERLTSENGLHAKLLTIFHSRVMHCVISKMHSQWFKYCEYLWSLSVNQRFLNLLDSWNSWLSSPDKYWENKLSPKVNMTVWWLTQGVQEIPKGHVGISAKIYYISYNYLCSVNPNRLHINFPMTHFKDF